MSPSTAPPLLSSSFLTPCHAVMNELILDVPLLTKTDDSGCDSSSSPQSNNEENLLLLVPQPRIPERRGSFVAEIAVKAASVTKDLGKAVPEKTKEVRHDIGTAWTEFCKQTTAHGLPMVVNHRMWIRCIWYIFSVISFVIFTANVIEIVKKYNRMDKIVNVVLEFESAPFPAVTVCNLNPFKRHLARSVPEISETLDAFHQAVIFSNDAAFKDGGRKKRDSDEGNRYVQYEPVYSACDCKRGRENECIGSDGFPPNEEYCICNFDRTDASAWPCYSRTTWKESICPECNDIGFCNVPNTTGTDSIPCICQLNMGYCILKAGSRIKRIWEIRGNKVPPKNSPFRKDFMEQLDALGYGNMTDQVAITTHAKEKLILKMSALPRERRAALGYDKSELIKMCSFNGLQCDIKTEFRLHTDASFGNCYTFNWDPKKNKTSSRAGPNYGLRLMMFVNSSDYLPTTEATGVRIAIHGQGECPFPDTFGYSAPTGAISSFGIALRKVNRLAQPNGTCHQGGLPKENIYKKYKYEPEGCFRSCYQHRIVRFCKCADPRFPKTREEDKICDTRNDDIQKCLAIQGMQLAGSKNPCRCVHACQQDVYTTTYSAAKWPSGSIRMECDNKAQDCNTYYHEHAAMLEIYYEQMSYEVLKESESYLLVNMVSDIGGQAGLWLGASILTLIELLSFSLRILWICACSSRKKTEDADEKEENHYETS